MFIERVGETMARPLSSIREATQQGPERTRDIAILLALGVICLETRPLVEQILTAIHLDVSTGLLGILQVVMSAISFDVVALLAASFLLTLTVPRGRRDGRRDFNLACIAWIPMFAARVAARLLQSLIGMSVARGLELLGMMAAIALLGVAIREVRR